MVILTNCLELSCCRYLTSVMIYFLLPKTHITTYTKIKYNNSDEINKFSRNTERALPLISHSLYNYLIDIKEQIHDFGKDWDYFKKYTNPYEYIHTYMPNKNKCIAKYKPISRAYFKMIEIIDTFQLFKPSISEILPPISYNGTYPVEYHRVNVENMCSHAIDTSFLKTSQSHNNLNLKNESNEDEKISKKHRNPLMYLYSDKTNIFQIKDSSIIKEASTCETYRFSLNTKLPKGNEVIPHLNQISHKSINTFHLAEGPGGFIEAFVNSRKNSIGSNNDRYIGMTIIDENDDYNIPGWKKAKDFLKDNPNIIIEKGKDSTGNLLNIGNFEYCVEKYGSSMDFITGDGGFDFSTNFSHQEESMVNLLFAQICYAVCMQKYGGTFILKIFDCFTAATVDILYILSSFYDKVYISKPFTSRYANSEKYIICKNFLFSNNEIFYKNMQLALINVCQEIDKNDTDSTLEQINNQKYVKSFCSHSTSLCSDKILLLKNNNPRFLEISITNSFITKLEEYNSIFGQQQLENIYQTISLIINEKIRQKKKNKNIEIKTLYNSSQEKKVKNNILKDYSSEKCSSLKNDSENIPYISFGWDRNKTIQDDIELLRSYPTVSSSDKIETSLNTAFKFHSNLNYSLDDNNKFSSKIDDSSTRLYRLSRNSKLSNNSEIISNNLEKLTKINIQKCIQWCIKYNISYNIF